MKDIFKKQYKDILLVLVYMAIAVAVYVMIANTLWNTWYISLLVGLAIFIISAIIGFIYIKSLFYTKKE